MKQHITTIILALLLAATATAQSHLNVAPMFEGKKEWSLKFTGSHIEGRPLKPYNLTLFRSITTSDHRLYDKIEALKSRANKLEQRDPVANRNIINKLHRKIRALENK